MDIHELSSLISDENRSYISGWEEVYLAAVRHALSRHF